MINVLFFLLIFVDFFSMSLGSTENPALNLCGKYIKKASRQVGVLPEILWGVTMTESNWKTGPWPWTLNIAGRPYFFKSKEKMKVFLNKLPKKKLNKTDIGCMQVNYYYHRRHFNSISEMIDPETNVIYGARFLKKLYGKTQNWLEAIGDYNTTRNNGKSPYTRHVLSHLKTSDQWWK